MANTDKLEIVLKFNGKRIRLDETGEQAQPTFKKILSIFSDSTDEEEITLGGHI